jgi:NAD(P)-dependent dehydrogenase (short-subunit alcohol dehydrogenase family)
MNKTAIVTGASRGIGFQTCLALAKKGHNIIATARSKEDLVELAGHFPDLILPLPADLTMEKDIEQLTEEVSNTYGSVDILVNNAGALINKSFENLTKDDWHKMININLLTAVDLTKSLLPFFSEDAHIINISSMGGFQGSDKFPGLSAYSAAKGALSILSECLSVELADRNINSNTLCLGAVQTEMLEEAFPGFEAPVSAEEMGTYIADFALAGSKFYNGQVLPVTLGNPE